MTPFEIVFLIVALPVVAATGYLVVLTLLSHRPTRQDLTRIGSRSPIVCFDIVVPAHDEEEGIARTVESLLSIDYPASLFQVTVVADNCTDDTAARARFAGARVLVRNEPNVRGKGHALAFAFDRILAERIADAVVVVDADTVVSPNLLRAFAARIEEGASAVQADYAVRNPEASWRTLLMAIALGAVHGLRSLARERLGLSAGLRGNGMCFTTSLLATVPHEAFSVVEDLEYGIRLGEAGHRVFYAHEAHVYGEMPSGERASGTQRQRWEAGRMKMARMHAGRLLLRAFRERNKVLLDLALDLLVPPLATLGLAVVLGLGLSLLVSRWAAPMIVAPWVFLAALVGLFAYGLRGWQISGTGANGLLALLFVPRYVAWKLWLRIAKRSGRADTEWVRTAREAKAR